MEAKKRVSTAIRDYLARERISREQFAFRTKLGKSTVDKLLIGLFSEKSLAIAEGHTKLPLRAMLGASTPGRQVLPDAAQEIASSSDRPSIAVLPFESMSADPGQDYFADGIVEDIITALSRVPRLLVIARHSTFTYKNRAVDIRQVGRELGVRYVLEGSVRRAGDKLRITGQLIDTSTGAHLWAERYDGGIEDVFDLQDRITSRVVGAITPRLIAAELVRSRSKRPENLDAYDLYLRALAAVSDMTRENNERALNYVERALRLDPDYAVVAGLGAWAYTLRAAQDWCKNLADETRRGIVLARTAIAKGADDPEALAMGGYTIAFLGSEFLEGLHAIDRSIELNPNGALALSHAGWLRCYLGRAAEAIGNFERVVTLSPRETTLFRIYAGLALAYLLLERFEESVMWGRRALESNPNFTPSYRVLAAALAHRGQIDEARTIGQRLLALMPHFSVETEKRIFAQSGKLPLILDGFRIAGLPS